MNIKSLVTSFLKIAENTAKNNTKNINIITKLTKYKLNIKLLEEVNSKQEIEKILN